MKLLPHYFKWIGLVLLIIGFLLGIDDFLLGFTGAFYNEEPEGFARLLPEFCSKISDYPMLIGLLIYILSMNKTEDEFVQKLRYESAFIVLVITIVVLLYLYIVNAELKVNPAYLLGFQMLAFLIVQPIWRSYILGDDNEK